MINRKIELSAILRFLKSYPVVGLIGARQVGKTTVARIIGSQWKGKVSYFDAENPEDQARLADPMIALKSLTGLVVIDEIQRLPQIFSVLRVLADRPGNKVKFLVLGSASPELLKQGSESLAGRIKYYEIGGFRINDIEMKNVEQLWFRGGFPKSYLSRSSKESFEWRQSFISTFLERDIPQLGININSVTLRRFWTMLANYHGQIWNSSEFARSFGVADTTVRGYLDRLTSALVVRQLLPWHANISKRQVKMPKIYLSDSGLLHTLLNLRTIQDVEGHPKLGASWEGFLLDQVIRHIDADKNECYFWATHAGAELDLLIVRGRQRIGFEFKRATAPKITPSMISAKQDLKLDELTVIFYGNTSFPLKEGIRAVGAENIIEDIKPLKG
ncbi:MAG: ATP-binding protein [Elusimicrobiota bacterium]